LDLKVPGALAGGVAAVAAVVAGVVVAALAAIALVPHSAAPITPPVNIDAATAPAATVNLIRLIFCSLSFKRVGGGGDDRRRDSGLPSAILTLAVEARRDL
jgi:hypothetical protein